MKSNVSNIVTDVAKAGDYVLSAPKILPLSNYNRDSKVIDVGGYYSNTVSITGKGFVTILGTNNNNFLYLYDLIIDGILVNSNRATTSIHKRSIWLSNTSTSNAFNKCFEPIYFEKSISFMCVYSCTVTTTPNLSLYNVTYQVGLK